MKQFKSFLIYLISFLFFILLSSSFCSEKYLSEAYSVNLSGKTLYYAFAGNLSDYLEGKIADEDEINLENLDKDYSVTYKEGDSGDEVLGYKLILYYMDFLSDKPDDTFDSLTVSAVKEYQNNRGLEQSGIFDKATMKSLDNEVVDYKQGKSSEDIKKYNYILYYLGYLEDEPNDTFTAETKVACENYQKEKELPVTGTITPQTRRSLDDETITYKKGHKGDVIKDYQNILIRAGYLKGSASGTFDSKTQAAVKSYQSDKSLAVTGMLDVKTMEALDTEH